MPKVNYASYIEEGLKLYNDEGLKTYGNAAEVARVIYSNYNLSEDIVNAETFRKILTAKMKAFSEAGEEKRSPAKILVYDIETAPLRSYVWALWNQNNLAKMVQSNWFMLCWSAKWLFGDKIMSDRLTGSEVRKEDDKRISKSLWELMDEADIVIAHNGLKFDNKRANTRFLLHDLGPTMPYQTIDTLAHAKKHLAFSSNRLDDIAKYLGLDGKMETGGVELWKECMNGNQEALEKMSAYCDKDVQVLEEVYLKLRPFIKPHPNMGLWIQDNVQCCPSCGSDNISFDGTYATYANVYQAFRCKECKSIGRTRLSNVTTEMRRNLTISTPK